MQVYEVVEKVPTFGAVFLAPQNVQEVAGWLGADSWKVTYDREEQWYQVTFYNIPRLMDRENIITEVTAHSGQYIVRDHQSQDVFSMDEFEYVSRFERKVTPPRLQ